MKRLLPPLNSIKIFEACAKHLSFTKAGEEIGLTQSAISKQIKLLEEYLGISLFNRFAQKIELTNESKSYYNAISSALDQIEIASETIINKGKEDLSLIINAPISISSHWLIPKIKNFKKDHPQFNIKITTSNESENYVDFSKLNADIAIRLSDDKINGIESQLLANEEMLCVCSPNLLIKKPHLSSHLDIDKYPLLTTISKPNIWQEWADSLNFTISKETQNYLGFEHYFMLIEAAKEGLGLAFIPKILLKKELSTGQLVNPLEIEYKTNLKYYLLYPSYKAYSYKIKLLVNWISSSDSKIS